MTLISNFNYNMPNMNFGETLANGLLGSLTGGGCYSNSIFNYSDSMIWANVMSTVLNTGTCFLTSARGGSGGGRKETISTAQNNIETLSAEITALKTENSKLMNNDGSAIEIKDNGTVSSDVQSVLPTQSSKYIETYKAYKALEKGFEKSSYFNNLSDIDKIKNNKGEYSTKYKGAKEAYDAELKRLSLQNANDLEALNNAIKKQIQTNLDKIEKKQDDLVKAQKELEEASCGKDKNIELSEKAKGILNKFNEKGALIKNNDLGEVNKDNVEDYKQAFNSTYQQFKKATTNQEKLAFATKAQAIYNQINNGKGTSSYINSDMQLHMNIMKSRIDNKDCFGL